MVLRIPESAYFRVRRAGDDMVQRTVRVVMNGVTGRMGYRQHLLRSVLAIRDDGGVTLPDGDRLVVEPVLVGRNAERLAALAAKHGVADHTTDLDEALGDASASIYFDAQVTSERKKSILKAISAGKHIYTEKPIAESVAEGIELVSAAREAGVINGVVHDKLYLPGLIKLKRLIDSGFFGRILSVRGEFGYWVFEGDLVPAQRPSWNYRAEDGGGIILDMFPHWNYVLENLFGGVRAVSARAVTHIPERWDEQGRRYTATADDAAYAIFELDGDVIAQVNSSWAVRVDREELVEFQVDGTHGSAVAGLFGCRVQPRVQTPMPVWNPDLPTTEDFRSQWHQVPDLAEFGNGFRAQWEQFLRDVDAGRPHAYDLAAGVRGLQLADAGLQSSTDGRRVAIDWFSA
jgi:predicted dehydrogenase